MTAGEHLLSRLRSKRPLVHCITNCVTANFCADFLLAAGASPVMADDPREAAEMASRADALYLNTGTPGEKSVEAMFLAVRAAKGNGVPVVFDPVGAGTTHLRTETARKMLELRPDAVKGNLSEMLFLAGNETARCKGVDSDGAAEKIGKEVIAETLRAFARRAGIVAVATGKTDFITDGETTILVANGTPLLAGISGAGCALGAFCAAAAAEAAKKSALPGVLAAAVAATGIAGEKARRTLDDVRDAGTFRMRLLDEIGKLTDEEITSGGRYELFA